MTDKGLYRTFTAPSLEEIGERIVRFQELMREAEVDISLIIYNPDLYYFTGVVQQGILLVEDEGEPIFFVRRFHERAVSESPLTRIVKIESPSEIEPYLGSRFSLVRRVGLELDVIPVNFYGRLGRIFPGKEFADVSNLIRVVRSLKSPFEIDLMRRSGKNLVRLLRQSADFIKEGRKEQEVVSDMIKVALDGGHGGTIRMRSWNQEISFGHVLSGESGCVGTYTNTPLGGRGLHPSFPFGPGERVIRTGEPIIVDVMWVEEGYITDMTRVYSIGEMHDRQIHEAHRVAIEILRRAEEMLRPGQSSRAVMEESQNIAADRGLAECFMGVPGNTVTFLGHGIGIEVDEYPLFAEGFDFTLAEGMTFALEPKFVIPGKGAVGVENTYLINSDGCENLTEMEENIIVI